MIAATSSAPSVPSRPISQTALSRAWIIFQDGGKITWYSFDSSGRYNVDDKRAYGVRGLQKRILERFPLAVLKEVRIYDNQAGWSTNPQHGLICYLSNGTWCLPQ